MSSSGAILFLILMHAQTAWTQAATKPAELKLAAAFQLPQVPGLSSLSGPSADWRQWDSFYTFVVKRFGQDLSGNLKDSLGDAFLDSRYELTSAVAPGRGGNPVPQLFLSSWKRLSPIMNQALPGLPKQTASVYASFISATNKLAGSGGQAGLKSGLVNLSPDVLKGLARIIEPTSSADPLAYTTNVDSGLRGLLGFGSPLATRGVRQGQLDRLFLPEIREASLSSFWLDREADAAEPDFKKLNQWVPDLKELEAYLLEVKALLIESGDKAAAKSKLAGEYKTLYRQIVLTSAWQESCWRQYVKKGSSITPLASSTGDLGLMQVNRNTWRGVYDLKGLGGDIEYNGNAGGEILIYYLTKHAIRKGEDKQPGGNLARATYSAYNGGPGAVGRYRAAKQNPALKKVDEAFWEKFQTVSSGKDLAVKSCYEKTPQT
jgi:Transglycosylase SLT domain